MLQYSKLVNDRHEGRKKAAERSEEVCELRKTQKRYRAKIAELKQHHRDLEQLINTKKKEK